MQYHHRYIQTSSNRHVANSNCRSEVLHLPRPRKGILATPYRAGITISHRILNPGNRGLPIQKNSDGAEELKRIVGLAYRTCVAFVDDICVYSKTIEEHKEHVYEVFQRLVRHGHSIRLDKCSFFQIEHEFLGYVISETGIKPSPRLVSGLTEMKHPRP